jgi:hypothetical protein
LIETHLQEPTRMRSLFAGNRNSRRGRQRLARHGCHAERDRMTATFEPLESRALLSGAPITISFDDQSNLTTPNKIYIGGWINGGQTIQSAITQVANVVIPPSGTGVQGSAGPQVSAATLSITANTANYVFDRVNPAQLTINGTGFGSVPSANNIVFYEDAAGVTLSPVNPNGAAGPFYFSIPDGTDTSLRVAFDASASGNPQPNAGPLYARISTTWAYPLQADGTFATEASPAVPFYEVASLSGGVSLDTVTNGNDRLVFVAAPVPPTATSSQTPWGNYPISALPQNTATVPPGPFGIMEFGYDAQFNTSYVDSFGLNWSFVDDAAPSVVYGVRPTIERSTIQSAYGTFTGKTGDPLGGPFNQLLWTSTTTPVPAVVDGQFTAIVSPKDWLSITPSSPTPEFTALQNYWTDTVKEFFKDGNQLNISLNGTAYAGTASGDSYTLQPGSVVIAKADYAGTAIFAQPQPDNSSVAGQLKDAVFEAFSRGVSLDGVWKAGRPGSPTAGYSSDAWTAYANWYKPGPTTYDPSISRTYDVYAKFFHYATSEGKDFRDPAGGKPMLGLNGKGWFAMAYGFSLDESPSVNTAGGNTWPTDASVNGGTNIGPGGSITVTFGPWASTAGPAVNAPATFTVPENTGADPGSNLVWPASPTPFSDADSDTLTVTLDVTAGTINGTDSPAHTGVTVGGTATARTFSGTITSLNAYFTTSGQITYTPPLDDLTSKTLTTRASDGTREASATSTIDIVAAELPQVSLAPTTFTIEQDGPRQVALDFTTASFTDPADLPADTVYTVKMTGSGTIQATSAGGVAFSSLGGGVYTFAGTLTNLDTYFQTPDRILYIPPLGSRTPTSPSFHGTRQLAVTLIRPTDQATSDPVTLTIVVQPNQPPVIQAPLTFAVTLNQATPLVWPASMTPFSDASAESLTVTLAVPTGVLAAASSGGVTVSGSTDIQKQFVGAVAALNAYFKAANISYTATGTTSQSRPLTITASDGAAHSEVTSTILVHNPTPDPNGPPTINPTTVLEWATENQWFVITYDQLVAASGANDPAHRTVEFTLAAVNSGTLQMNWHGMWIPAPTPRFGQAPPFLMQGGTIRWLPPANTVNSSGQLAFTVGLFDLNQRSLGTSQVFIKIRA